MTRDDLLHALQSNNVQAFLRVIRQGESSQDDDAYRLFFGGSHFESFADHPRTKHTAGKWTSTAAGAYQFLMGTWDGLVKQYKFPDFSPQNQDLGAVALIAGRKALDDVLAGRIHEAIRKCAAEWASLPGSTYGQPTQALKTALEVFTAYGGTIAASSPALPIAPTPLVTQEVKPMAPLVLPLLNILASAIPQLGSLFGSGSEVANRNIAAGTLVADAVVKATQAVNLQDAVEKVQNDPQALQAAKEAVSDVFFQLSEAGGGGIDGARKAAAATDQQPFWKQGAFYISLALIVMPYMLLADTFYVHPDSYDGNLRTQIVTGVMLIISIVGAFWLGSTFGSQKKDSLLAGK